MLVYKLEIEITGDDWERTEFYFFKSYDDREEFKKQYEEKHTKNGEYIPTISSIHYYNEDTVFEQVKDQMTVSQYEKLFDISLKPNNNNLELNDLEKEIK